MPIIIALLLLFSNAANGGEWHALSSTNGVKIYSQPMDKPPYQKLRAEMEVETSSSAFLTLLLNTQAISSWVEHGEGAEVLIYQHPNRHLVHTRFDPPWPVHKRDLVTASHFWQDGDSGIIYLSVESRPNALATQPGYLRLLDAEACWQLTPIDEDSILIRYEGFTNPGGNLPYFVTNQVGIEALIKTFTNMKHLLILPAYRFANPEIPRSQARNSRPCADLLAQQNQ